MTASTLHSHAGWPPRKAWAAVRAALGLVQMVAAMTTAILLLQTGVNWLTMTGLTVTLALVAGSRWLFRGH